MEAKLVKVSLYLFIKVLSDCINITNWNIKLLIASHVAISTKVTSINCIKSLYKINRRLPSKIDDVLLEHGGLPHVLPLTVHLKFLGSQVKSMETL